MIGLGISKAFDRVWHKNLLAKLPAFGLPPLESFLSNLSIKVEVDGISDPRPSMLMLEFFRAQSFAYTLLSILMTF